MPIDAQPETENTDVHTENTVTSEMTENTPVMVTFGQENIDSLSLNNEGALVIKFANGEMSSTLVIDDVASLANSSVCLPLSGGDVIDVQALYSDLCNDMGICIIEKPDAGSSLDVALSDAHKYDLKFEMEDGKEIAREALEAGEELTLTFGDGAQITFQSAQDLIDSALSNDVHGSDTDPSAFLSALDVIEGLVERMEFLEAQYDKEKDSDGQLSQELASIEHDIATQLAGIEPATEPESSRQEQYASNDTTTANDASAPAIFQMVKEIAAQKSDMAAAADNLAKVEPAAGENSAGSAATGSNSGYGLQSSFDAQGVIGLEDVGPIDPTKLEYGIERNNDELFVEEETGDNSPPPPQKEDFKPEIFSSKKVLDETDGLALSESGVLAFDFGGDGAGEVTTTGSYDTSGSLAGGDLASGGHSVVITASANGYTGTANGQNVFTFTLDPQSGEYVYTQILPFDHADGTDNNDAIILNFGVQVADADGDSAVSTVQITVLDDGPKDIKVTPQTVDETDLSAANPSVSGQINADFGQDGAGSISGSGDFLTTGLTSQGSPVGIIYDATSGTYTGTANGNTIFTLSIAPDGSYDFELSGTLDHPDTNDPNDALNLTFGVRATDFDGDSIDGSMTITVLDDGPIAKDDCVKFDTQNNSVDGNVIANDELSQDIDNSVTEVSFNGVSVSVPVTGSTTIDGDFGVLEISADGSYTYTLNGGTTGGTSSTNSLSPVAADVAGQQNTLTKDGITVSVANAGDYDLTWVDTSDGSGLGIDNLNQGDSPKVWPKGETFDIALDNTAQSVTITIAEIGSNNNQGLHGVDYTITFEDGSTMVGEQQFVPGQIVDGTFDFTLDSADYNGLEISSIALNSTNDGQYKGASFLLNNVVAQHSTHTEICDIFEYTLTDGDGDSSVATLKIKGLEPELIVGENVDDISTSHIPHHIGGEEGVIAGGPAGDILIGDVGGASIDQQTQDYNFVFIVDVSGSMGKANDPLSQISILKDAVENLLNEFGDYQSGDIQVHLVPFATDVKPSGTFTVTDPSGLNSALQYLETYTGSGYTNYESPLQEANAWLQSGEPIGGNAITTTYFISDGEPNRYVDDSGNVQSGNASTVVEQITGSDGSDEVALLHSLNNDVIAVGVNASSNTVARLNVIDLDGDALNIDDASDLSVVFKETSPFNNLAQVGNDVIEGGEGDDLIYGDSVHTDALADAHNLDIEDGAGWDVFDKLENSESASDPSWSREDTIEHLRNNHEYLAEESTDSDDEGRQGGNDVIHGGAGDDIIYGQEGDDIIYGDAGNDIITGGSGADTFVENAVGQGVDVIRDFSVDGGDVLDLAGLIQNYDPTQKAIDEFVFTREVDGGTVLSVDVNGSGNSANAVDLVALEGLQNIDLQALFENGTINVM